MLNQFSGTELLLGKEAMDKLAHSRVAVFGIGGVGGYTVEALVRSGIGAVDLIDDDKICLTNINRQIYATRKTVGKYHCTCPPDTKRKCTIRRQVPGSNAFVPPVVGLIIAGEVVKELSGYGT